NVRAIEGRLMLTIDASRVVMNVPSATSARTAHRLFISSSTGAAVPAATTRVTLDRTGLANHMRGRSPQPIHLPGVPRSKLSDTRPVECFAALSQQRQESVTQQARHRHGHAKVVRCRKCQADILVSEWRGEPRRLELPLGDQAAIGLVDRGGEQGRRQKLEILVPVDAGLADAG